ncbi:uncharacterized protein BJ171DRAFT_28805 [Polychytrium aggregatum]|uniref:uncharacterized protein n=1 Tax=Polychytrium aggregatum TaxID=110093 RepID=UPI0022FF23DE|nr:uncharacterized protein BJ171DRAFT_28805 [Polychytrium aggregatum]KAI9206350.1 hypothetical protein BJ171DRAFT_28805 [Polychytrium aggregatum]
MSQPIDPSKNPAPVEPTPDDQQQKPETVESRLYIGNLDPSITEFKLIKMFERFGPIARIDYLWYKVGPKKGQPRGYCFLEFIQKEDAAKALSVMKGKIVSGRTLVVSYSHEQKKTDFGPGTLNHKLQAGVRPEYINPKLQPRMTNTSVDAKIAALERKLSQIDGKKEASAPSSRPPISSSSSSRVRKSSSGRHHPY